VRQARHTRQQCTLCARELSDDERDAVLRLHAAHRRHMIAVRSLLSSFIIALIAFIINGL
jgi:hypothetical protein